MTTQYFIFDLAAERYYASYPDGFSKDVLDAVSFNTEKEAETRIEEILTNNQCLTIIKNFVNN